MNTFIIKLFIVSIMVNLGFALNCYVCQSPTNDQCDPFDKKSFITQECTKEQFKPRNDMSWLDTMSLHPYTVMQSEASVKAVCQHLVGYNDKNERSVLRSCQMDINDNACNLTIKKFHNEQRVQKNYINYRIEECLLCKTDSCNSAYAQFMYMPIIFIFSGLSIMRIFL